MILSPSSLVKIQIIGGKLYLRYLGKTLLGDDTKLFFQKFVDNAQQRFVFTPQANFPVHNLNFHWRWWDRIQATFKNLFYFAVYFMLLLLRPSRNAKELFWQKKFLPSIFMKFWSRNYLNKLDWLIPQDFYFNVPNLWSKKNWKILLLNVLSPPIQIHTDWQ